MTYFPRWPNGLLELACLLGLRCLVAPRSAFRPSSRSERTAAERFIPLFFAQSLTDKARNAGSRTVKSGSPPLLVRALSCFGSAIAGGYRALFLNDKVQRPTLALPATWYSHH